MRRTFILLAAAAFAAVAASSAGAGSSVGITIRHAMHGCHVWSVAGATYTASQTVQVAAGTSFVFKNNDVMPHTIVQLAGPKVALRAPKLGRVGAHMAIILKTPGVYRFKTIAGEDYPGMELKTVGEDSVLRLKVIVR